MSKVYNPKPHLTAKRYTLPDGCDCKKIVMRELDSQDEIEASMWADKNASSAAESSAIAAMVADRRESLRLSILEVDGIPVNVDGVPFKSMDEWTIKTVRILQECFGDLNGVGAEELKNVVAGAEVVGASPALGDSDDKTPQGE